MATASPTTATNATRRKGGKRPATEPTNGPSSVLAVNDGSGTSAKKQKIETPAASKIKIKKEVEEASSVSKTAKKGKEAGTVGDEQQDKENHDNRQTLVFNWTAEELQQLIGNLSNCLPKTDNVKYSTLIDKLDWEKVRFHPYTAAECKDKWTQIMTRLRRFRTLTDMVTDAKEWLKHPWSSYSSSKKQKHPEMPKKPLTPYFRYFLEKRQKHSKEHPDMSMTELAKILSKKYQELPEKKKQKYKENYERENEVYKQELEKFKKEHPDQFPSSDVKQHHALHEGPNRPQTPFQHFFVDRIKKAEFADLEKKEMTEKARKIWSSLSQAKKVKWIKKAEQDQQKYLVEVDEYCQSHPNFKPDNFRSVLSKAEKEMKDRYDGKPEKPPNSGYSLFSRVMLRQLTDVPSKQKMSEISRRWKELNEKDRLSYVDDAQKAIEDYRVRYANYLKNLPEEERQKLENETKNSKKKPVVEATSPESDEKKSVCNDDGVEDAQNRQKKPPVFFYQQEKIGSIRQKHSELSKQELMKLLAKDYNDLPEKKKEKYKKIAEEVNQQDEKAKNTKSVKSRITESGSRKQRLYKGEPRKPPASGYSLFTTETLGSIAEGDSKNRMSAVAARWNTLSDVEKEKYKKRSREMVKKYKIDIAKFIAGLSEAEREEYTELRTVKRGGAKSAVSKLQKEQTAPVKNPAPTKKKKQVESESSDDSSGDDDEEDDDDDDDDDGDGDGSEKSGNDESGSDESGSDSDDDENDDDDDSDDDSEEEKKDGDNDSSSGESGSESDSNSGSSDNSSESGSESDD